MQYRDKQRQTNSKAYTGVPVYGEREFFARFCRVDNHGIRPGGEAGQADRVHASPKMHARVEFALGVVLVLRINKLLVLEERKMWVK